MDRLLREEGTRKVAGLQAEKQQAFVLLKPESVVRGLIGEIITRFERKGFTLAAAKLVRLTDDQAHQLYSIHSTKPFFQELISHITSSPVFLMVWEGPNVIAITRNMVGATNPVNAAPGSIRGDFAVNVTPNAIHASDSIENAKRELSIFFTPAEICSYAKPTEQQFLLK